MANAVPTTTGTAGSLESVMNTSFQQVAAANPWDQILTVGSLVEDINNVTQLANFFNHGWVGSDPLFSNAYFFQPAAYKGTFIPRSLVKSVTLPSYVINTKIVKFRGTDGTSFATGSTTGNMSAVFYENQEFQVSTYLRSWMADTVGPGGKSYGIPNDYKYTMFFINNQSLGQPNDTLLSKLANKVLPNSVLQAAEKVLPVAITFLFNCYPTTFSFPTSENQSFDICEINATFSCDAIIQIPCSVAMLSEIFSIIGKNNSVSDFLDINVPSLF